MNIAQLTPQLLGELNTASFPSANRALDATMEPGAKRLGSAFQIHTL